MKVIILAGGGGTRLWPVSRKNSPKQVQPFIDQKTLLQATFERLKTGFPVKDIYVSANVKQQPVILKQLPDFPPDNLILEPEKRDTAPAIGLAAVKLLAQDPEAKFVTINSDAYIENVPEYIRILKLAEQVVDKYPNKSVLVGINPTYPETGYGYIQMASQFDRFENGHGGYDEIFAVERFVEKPDLETARRYVAQWEYLWNPAVFVWRAALLMEKFKQFLPEHYTLLQKIQENITEPAAVDRLFSEMAPISIDYGIMEKVDNMLVIPADFGWADIGHWRTVKDVLSRAEDNLIKGAFVGEDNHGNLIYNYTDKLISTIGLTDMVIIQTEDVLLICPKSRCQDVKKIVEKLKQEKLDKYL